MEKKSENITVIDAFIVILSMALTILLIFNWVFQPVHSHQLNALGVEITHHQPNTTIIIKVSLALLPVLFALIWAGRRRST
jgi:hypothetical protein